MDKSLTLTNWTIPHEKLGVSLMEHLFMRLSGIYGSKWDNAFIAPEMKSNWMAVWASAFDYHKLTPQDIKNGLDNCPILYPDWTPTLGQFITACKHKETRHACHEKFAALPKPNYPKEKAMENLAKMKALLADSPLINRINQQEK